MILQQTSGKLFRNVKSKERITEKEVKYFTIDFNKAINMGKLYLLFHKFLSEVPGRNF